MPCPCGKPLPYEKCCGQYIDASILPPDPETLMRSRYTAFVLGKIDYLAKTMKGKALKNFNFEGLESWLSQVTWQRLTVIKSKMKTNIHGFVWFEARYLEKDIPKMICEKSEFKKIEGKWFYIDGKAIRGL